MLRTVLRSLAALIALVIILVAVAIAATRAPEKPVADVKPRGAQAPSQFIEVQGLQVHLRDEGPRDDAVPIILLHGTSASLHTWQGWVDALKGQRRVIRFDLPGFALT